MTLKIAVPNKGRLMEDTLDLLRSIGVRVPHSTDRTLVANTNGGRYQILFARAQDIPNTWRSARPTPGSPERTWSRRRASASAGCSISDTAPANWSSRAGPLGVLLRLGPAGQRQDRHRLPQPDATLFREAEAEGRRRSDLRSRGADALHRRGGRHRGPDPDRGDAQAEHLALLDVVLESTAVLIAPPSLPAARAEDLEDLSPRWSR